MVIENIEQMSQIARLAIQRQDWAQVSESATKILKQQPKNAEGLFLAGVLEKVANRPVNALQYFQDALEQDAGRYDAAIELANQYSIARRNGEAAQLLSQYKDKLTNSSVYSDLAGTIYTDIGMAEEAYPLFQQAVSLQPKVDLFQANLASCSVFLGKITEAKAIYSKLLQRFPAHQRNHYQLARLEKAKDESHLQQMLTVLEQTKNPPDRNIFIYFAIAKEYEDLGRWAEAFEYYQKGGDAVCSVARYDVNTDIELIDTIIRNCHEKWLNAPAVVSKNQSEPIFVVGLPRTGTTLCERIISSHSQVETLGETLFFQMILRRESGVQSTQAISREMIEALIEKDPATIAKGYMEQVSYRLHDNAFFIDKLPFNILYLGFFAKAFPKGKIVYLHRNPMDACFAMYKQVFTWAYKFSYSLEDLGKYYVAFDRLMSHWKAVLGDRIVEVKYEELVHDTEGQTRSLLTQLKIPFETACLDFDQNSAPSATASSVQIREKAHKNSVDKWRRFEKELAPLESYLTSAGIKV